MTADVSSPLVLTLLFFTVATVTGRPMFNSEMLANTI